jgi:hypothetical protein
MRELVGVDYLGMMLDLGIMEERGIDKDRSVNCAKRSLLYLFPAVARGSYL